MRRTSRRPCSPLRRPASRELRHRPRRHHPLRRLPRRGPRMWHSRRPLAALRPRHQRRRPRRSPAAVRRHRSRHPPHHRSQSRFPSSSAAAARARRLQPQPRRSPPIRLRSGRSRLSIASPSFRGCSPRLRFALAEASYSGAIATARRSPRARKSTRSLPRFRPQRRAPHLHPRRLLQSLRLLPRQPVSSRRAFGRGWISASIRCAASSMRSG